MTYRAVDRHNMMGGRGFRLEQQNFRTFVFQFLALAATHQPPADANWEIILTLHHRPAARWLSVGLESSILYSRPSTNRSCVVLHPLTSSWSSDSKSVYVAEV